MGMGLSHMERSCINHVEHSRILVGVAKLLRNTRIGVSVYERCRKMVPSSLYAYLSLRFGMSSRAEKDLVSSNLL